MPNENNNSIRYLMKEMDPSEELLMERSMMEDENLLIEVESLRQILQRVDRDLPMMEPPPELTKKIIQKAIEEKSGIDSRFIPFPLSSRKIGYAAAAAVVAIGMISGVFLYQSNSGIKANSQAGQVSSASVSSNPAVSSTTDVNGNNNSSDESKVKPWINHDEIIQFQDQFSAQNKAAFDSILDNSTKKLKQVTDPLESVSPSPSLQLTGSGN